MPALRGKFVLTPIGAVLLVRCIEVVRISESPFHCTSLVYIHAGTYDYPCNLVD